MFTIRRLTAADAAAFRELRLDHLSQHPTGAGAAWHDEVNQPLAWFEQRIADNATFGGFLSDGDKLAGMAGLVVPSGRKMRHKGMLAGMYVAPAARGTGMARAVVDALLAYASGVVEEVHLRVDPDSEPAIRLYRAAGFEQYGREPRALKIDGKHHDALLMTLPLKPSGN
jgi:RimJ/RimL family protein N-acetyltransferase